MADSLAGGKGLPPDEAQAVAEAALREAARRTRTTMPQGRPAADAARKRLPQREPTGTPKHRVRRVAVLYSPEREKEAAELWAALHDIGQSLKRPLFLRAVLLEAVLGPTGASAAAGKAGVGGAIAALALLDGEPATAVAAAFEKRRIRLISVPPGKAGERATLVDVMAELLVLDPVAFTQHFGWGEGFEV